MVAKKIPCQVRGPEKVIFIGEAVLLFPQKNKMYEDQWQELIRL